MSKIQEALKKIQGADHESHRGGQAEEQPLAQVTIPQAEEDVEPAPQLDNRLVVVDREQLRKAGLMAPEDQERHVAHQYRIIKRPILNLATGHAADRPEHANLVMIASALPGDGKTFNAINVALSIAVEKDNSVLLVDADVAKPHISKLFGLSDEPGLIDLLVQHDLDIESVVIKTDVPGLSILPAGHPHEFATELLASRRMAEAATRLAEAVPDRIVIFDSPPLLVTSESRVLASRMGQIVLVVCAGKTPQQAVVSAVDSLDSSKAINVILNQAGTILGEGGYGGYGYGYGVTS